jgi:hypothetical protein
VSHDTEYLKKVFRQNARSDLGFATVKLAATMDTAKNKW